MFKKFILMKSLIKKMDKLKNEELNDVETIQLSQKFPKNEKL